MKNKSIYITRQIPEEGIKMLQEKGYKLTISKSKRPPTHEELIKAVSKKKYDVVVTLLTDHIDTKFFDACPSVKLVANYTVGFNNIDVEEAKKRGIKVTNTRGTSGPAVAEHAVALMMSLTTRLVEGDKFMRKGKYRGWDPNLMMGQDIAGKTVGILGAGAIGRTVGNIMHKGFGCKIFYYDACRNEQFEKDCNAEFMSVDEVCEKADIVSLHVPLLKETTHLINKERLHKMKKSAILINTARGPVVDEEALYHALKDGRIYGAGLDVYEHEPKLVDGLSKLDNVVLTPHIASARPSARVEISKLVAQNIKKKKKKDGEVVTSVY